MSGPNFSWSAIDGIKIELRPRIAGGPPATVSVDRMNIVPPQNEGKVVFVFDDRYGLYYLRRPTCTPTAWRVTLL